MGQARTVKPHQGLRCTALVLLLLTSSCVETGNRRAETALKPVGDGGHCMDLAHDCAVCEIELEQSGENLTQTCPECTKYRAECK